MRRGFISENRSMIPRLGDEISTQIGLLVCLGIVCPRIAKHFTLKHTVICTGGETTLDCRRIWKSLLVFEPALTYQRPVFHTLYQGYIFYSGWETRILHSKNARCRMVLNMQKIVVTSARKILSLFVFLIIMPIRQ